jgi:hypothetical protein
MLGVRLPAVLREFHLAWGQRTDWARTVQTILAPIELFWHADGLVIGVENQGVYFWGISRTDLSQDNPPVKYIYDGPEAQWLPSHKQLCDFLDYLVYWHVLAGGAPHGGYCMGRFVAPALVV